MEISAASLTARDAYHLLTQAIVPRPIALVSTVSVDGTPNLAPFSFFTGISSHPPTVCFTVARRRGQKKDTVVNAEETGEFVINVVPEALAEAMNATSAEVAPEVDEFELARLTMQASMTVKPPRVNESPLALECRYIQTVELGTPPGQASLVIGEVLSFHVDDSLLTEGKVDQTKLRVIGRLSGDLYCRTRDVFSMKRPT